MESMERFAGLDWGFREHVACVVDGSGAVLEERAFAHGGAGLLALAEWLRSHGGPAVAMETPRGPLAAGLAARGIDVRSINPLQSDRFRDRHSPSGAKDDRRDARVLANALRTDPDSLRRVPAETAEGIALGSLLRRLDWLKEERARLSSRLRAELWEFYPEFEAMAAGLKADLAAQWVLALLGRLPVPGSVRGVRDATLAKLLRRSRKADPAAVRAALDVPAMASAARIAAGAAAAGELRGRLLATVRGIAELERELDRALDAMKRAPGEVADGAGAAPDETPGVPSPKASGSDGAPGSGAAPAPSATSPDDPPRPAGEPPERPSDAWLLATVPGIGSATLAILLCNAADALRQPGPQPLRCLCGTVPVTLQSGKGRRVVRRAAVDPDLRNAMHLCARDARNRDPGLRALYDRLRQAGHGDARALRGVADAILRAVCAMLRTRKPWDPSIRQPKAA